MEMRWTPLGTFGAYSEASFIRGNEAVGGQPLLALRVLLVVGAYLSALRGWVVVVEIVFIVRIMRTFLMSPMRGSSSVPFRRRMKSVGDVLKGMKNSHFCSLVMASWSHFFFRALDKLDSA